METLEFLRKGREILESLGKNTETDLLQCARALLDENPEQALAYYILAACYQERKDYIKAIGNYTLALRKDPEFVEAAKILLELNKDNYSVGELKYLYMLISKYQGLDPEMQQFLRKFRNTHPKADLSVPETPGIEDISGTLPGTSDNDYIRHLLDEMEQPEALFEANMQEEAVASISLHDEKLPFPGESIEDKEEIHTAGNPVAAAPENSGTLKALDFQPPPKQMPPQQNNIKSGPLNGYGIETMTMAQLYIRQGLYENAMQILLKLQQRDPESERVKNEIERVKECMKEEIKES